MNESAETVGVVLAVAQQADVVNRLLAGVTCQFETVGVGQLKKSPFYALARVVNFGAFFAGGRAPAGRILRFSGVALTADQGSWCEISHFTANS